MASSTFTRPRALGLVSSALFVAVLVGGCPPVDDGDSGDTGYANTTDKTNDNAAYVGSRACASCHSSYAESHALHGHAQMLTGLDAPESPFPDRVPNPPVPLGWDDIAYVIGGYRIAANFVDSLGFIATDATIGTPTLWTPGVPANGTPASFIAYEPTMVLKPYDSNCFQCHTTGPVTFDAQKPTAQNNLPGIRGTWAEDGVQCESCHGPGADHFTSTGPDAIVVRNRIFVDSGGARTCATCHSWPFGDTSGEIAAAGGFVHPYEQAAELEASGGHSAFACTFCHDPHVSLTQDRSRAIRNTCTACHTTVSMAGHGDELFERSDGYREVITCESCHMPYAGKLATSAAAGLVGADAKVGDVRSHIFRIDSTQADVGQFFTDDGLAVRRDAQGRAALTVDFVCLRCHNGDGAFALTPERATDIAPNVHALP